MLHQVYHIFMAEINLVTLNEKLEYRLVFRLHGIKYSCPLNILGSIKNVYNNSY